MNRIISTARTIPNYLYTCSKIFKKEKELIFRKNLINIGRINQLPSYGNYVCGKFFNDPYFIIKSEKEIKAFYNVCRHHGTILLENKDKNELDSKKIQCK